MTDWIALATEHGWRAPTLMPDDGPDIVSHVHRCAWEWLQTNVVIDPGSYACSCGHKPWIAAQQIQTVLRLECPVAKVAFLDVNGEEVSLFGGLPEGPHVVRDDPGALIWDDELRGYRRLAS